MSQPLVRHTLASAVLQKARSRRGGSQNAFARALGLRPGEMSGLLRGRRTLTAGRLKTILAKNTYSKVLTQEECSQLIEIGSVSITQTSLQRDNKIDVQLEEFRKIEEWYHFPVRALLESDVVTTHDRKASEKVAERLGLPVELARSAIERLKEANVFPDPLKPKQIHVQNHHTSLTQFNIAFTERALLALKTIPPEDRHCATFTVACDPAHLELARKAIDEFIQQLMALLWTCSPNHPLDSKREVFHYQAHFFSLEQLSQLTVSNREEAA